MNEEINWRKIKKIFFVGIKGVGMTPLALIAKDYGFELSGADVSEEFITDEVLIEKGIKFYEGFAEKNIAEFFENEDKASCLVITTGAHSGYKNPLSVWAVKNNIPVLNQGKALGIFMTGQPFDRTFEGVAVAGSHGKTTISALLSSTLKFLDFDPSYSVGTSKIFPNMQPGHLGTGKFFVAEGDEYVGEPVFDRTPKILYLLPRIAIINNIDFDHPDVYEDIADVKNTILEFINSIKRGGRVFLNADDSMIHDLKTSIRDDLEIITYGRENADYSIKDIELKLGSVTFNVQKKGESLGAFSLSIPGFHNALNSLAVIAFLNDLGIETDRIKEAVRNYKGCKRRMEFVGNSEDGALIVDDYGHHPAEIRTTLKALKAFYGKRIICVFQSHTYSRTKELWNDFLESFEGVDELVLLPIFRSQRDTEKDIISDMDFAQDFRKFVPKTYLAKNINEAKNYIANMNLDNNFLILTIGAGDVYKVGYKLKK